jgi:branched-chain amino acid transport system ATP-binding protein
VIEIENLRVRFGGVTPIDGMSVSFPRGTCGLIGPNGAGKTTFFNALTGLYKVTSGQVILGDRLVTGLPPHKIASLGMARTFQNIRLFGLMTAEENVKVAMHSHLHSGISRTVLRTRRQRREERDAHEQAVELLDFVGIGKNSDEYARNLSYGDQRRLEVARALALRPRVLLLDEPTAGMNPRESAQFVDFVNRVRDEKRVSILLIEHDMSVVMRVSERITVLDRGEKIAEGDAEEIKSNPRVVEAYLGKAAAEGGTA